jgi:large conductance mechanosensitive channel
MLQEFKEFIFRGNLLDLAVAVILGVAFGSVVTAFTDGIIMAFIAAIFGEPSFDSITIGLGDGEILIGTFLTALVNFLIIAAVLFFILKAAAMAQRSKREAEDAPVPTDEAILLTEIRDLLSAQGGGGAGRQGTNL